MQRSEGQERGKQRPGDQALQGAFLGWFKREKAGVYGHLGPGVQGGTGGSDRSVSRSPGLVSAATAQGSGRWPQGLRGGHSQGQRGLSLLWTGAQCRGS